MLHIPELGVVSWMEVKLMSGKGLNEWRPMLGVAAVGVLAFGWSLQSALGEPERRRWGDLR